MNATTAAELRRTYRSLDGMRGAGASDLPAWWEEREAFLLSELARGDMAPRARREAEAALEVVRRSLAARRQSHSGVNEQ